jgi:methionyl-tRNA synthetase
MTDKLLITSALPYINGVKHLGNLVGSLLPADVHARYNRQRGREVLFVCGTDEHGTPAELAALAAGQPVAEFCAEQHAIQAEIYRRFDISTDHFSRTSGETNARLTQDFFKLLDGRGYIEARHVRQVWSVQDRRFLPDRYVTGTCPHCGFTRARGDQCDGCTRLLDPADLLHPRSAISGSTELELREVEHLFLRQSALVEELRAWIEDGEGEWEPLVRSIALKWLDEGLEDRCITRDLEWGVPVPKAGFEHLRFYVWFDAPIGYLAAVHEWCALNDADPADWLARGSGRRWVQFLAKDNVPFHSVSFPATLLGSGADVRLVDRIHGLNWLTYEGGKFSTSEQRGVFTDVALEEFPADVWRWWLAANAPEGGDTDFSFPLFSTGVNADLSDNVGNLVNRLLRFSHRQFGTLVPSAGVCGLAEAELVARSAAILEECAEHFEALRHRRACSSLRQLWSLGNAYVSEQAPWTVVKTDPDRAACIVRAALNHVALAASASASIIPQTAARILDAVGSPVLHGTWPSADCILQGAGDRELKEPGILFPRIDANRVQGLQARFGG